MQALQAFCSGLLADYKVPESFSISPERLPRNPNGKLDKKRLREIAAAMPEPVRASRNKPKNSEETSS
jgi:acyl-CoA synthetase (AMP-forming)/AMP-acid ligase II